MKRRNPKTEPGLEEWNDVSAVSTHETNWVG